MSNGDGLSRYSVLIIILLVFDFQYIWYTYTYIYNNDIKNRGSIAIYTIIYRGSHQQIF